MNLQNIFSQIAEKDPEFYERISPRRRVMKNLLKGVAATALPFALGSMLNKAYGGTNASVTEVLQYALLLERLEAKFYGDAYANTGQFAALNLSGDDKTVVGIISQHETEHVKLLTNALGNNAGTSPVFDFTAKGTFNTNNRDVFFKLAQAFEDTGVRAYKGAAGDLQSDDATLTIALQIHSVEARHAAKIRSMNAKDPNQAWITGNVNNTGVSQADGVYAKDNVTNQGGVEITNVAGVGGNISFNAATQAFDEPLTMDEVKAIASLFIV